MTTADCVHPAHATGDALTDNILPSKLFRQDGQKRYLDHADLMAFG